MADKESEAAARSRYSTVFRELLEALREVPTSNELTLEVRERLRKAAEAARSLIRTDNLRTRGEWEDRGHLRRGKLYLEENDLRRLEHVEALLKHRLR